MVATMVEFTHRLTSGVALVLVFVLAAWVFRERPKGHPARRAAVASVVLILVEAAVGAARPLRPGGRERIGGPGAVHARTLANTFMLLAALALTAHWCGTNAPLRRDALRRDGWVFALAFLLLLVVGKSGAVGALGDTLYPAQSLLAGLAQDLSPTASILVRLRILHPLLAAAGTLAVAFAAARVLRSTVATSVRRMGLDRRPAGDRPVRSGLLNLVLLAPVWMQIVHLLLADAVWITLVLLAARALALAPAVTELKAAPA